MIRQGFLFWVLLVGGAGVALFLLKYEVQAREERLARINAEIIRTQEAIQVLRAEWSYLNRPDRLADLATRHLDLVPASGRQIAVSLTAVPEARPVITPDGLPLATKPRAGDPLVFAPLDKPRQDTLHPLL
ncbi:MAG: hypothetical protein H5U25_03440, partial [Oceanibaculum nanhaiense]|nr:hypothetical protein [Oceanibaculum nanhaiense]